MSGLQSRAGNISVGSARQRAVEVFQPSETVHCFTPHIVGDTEGTHTHTPSLILPSRWIRFCVLLPSSFTFTSSFTCTELSLALNPLENDPVLLYLYFAGLSCRKDRCGTRSNLFFSILSVNTLLLCLSVVLTIRGRVLLLKKTLDEDAKVHLPWTEVCGCQRGAFDVGRTVAVWLELWICIKAWRWRWRWRNCWRCFCGSQKSTNST